MVLAEMRARGGEAGIGRLKSLCKGSGRGGGGLRGVGEAGGQRLLVLLPFLSFIHISCPTTTCPGSTDLLPRQSIARTLPSLPKHLLPFPSIFTVDRLNLASPTAIGSRVNALLAPLDMRWQWKATQRTGVGFAERNVWSRAARRGRRRKDADRAGKQDEDDSEEGEEERALGVKIVVRDPGDGDDGGSEGAEAGGQSGKGTEGEGVVVEIRWLVGKDSVLFESFCGMVKREVTKGMKGD